MKLDANYALKSTKYAQLIYWHIPYVVYEGMDDSRFRMRRMGSGPEGTELKTIHTAGEPQQAVSLRHNKTYIIQRYVAWICLKNE